MPDGIPVIRLTVEGMKHQIMHALMEHELALSNEIQRAVEAFCQPENIQAVINREVNAVVSSVIREEIDRFYRRGDGRAVIRTAVEERLRTGGWEHI